MVEFKVSGFQVSGCCYLQLRVVYSHMYHFENFSMWKFLKSFSAVDGKIVFSRLVTKINSLFMKQVHLELIRPFGHDKAELLLPVSFTRKYLYKWLTYMNRGVYKILILLRYRTTWRKVQMYTGWDRLFGFCDKLADQQWHKTFLKSATWEILSNLFNTSNVCWLTRVIWVVFNL